MNNWSLQSHTILKIIMKRETVLNVGDNASDENKENLAVLSKASLSNLVVKTSSTLNLVNLVGSKSMLHMGKLGIRKKEGRMINQR